MRGLFRVLELLKESTSCDYTSYYNDMKAKLYKLFNKYERKFGAARTQRTAQPVSHIGKKKQACERIFEGPRYVVSSSSAYALTLSSPACAISELSVYLNSNNVTTYEDDFELLFWWRDHKLTYPILFIMARDIMSAPVSTVSSESCFTLIGMIIEERRCRLLLETVERLACWPT